MSSTSSSSGKAPVQPRLSVGSLPSPVSDASPLPRTQGQIVDLEESPAREEPAEQERPTRKRKKHTKSRLGCTQCKARKIKCSESRPFCTQCLERDLSCTYPITTEVSNPSVVRKLQEQGSASPLQAVSLNSTGQTFTMIDMQSFHAFLFAAHPNQPFANEMTWVTRIPSIAYKDESLMHAVLAQGAFFLDNSTGLEVSSAALSHRVAAVAGVKNAIANFNLGSCTATDRDALIASVFILWYQSLYFEDGINDFTTLGRGAAVIVRQLWDEDLSTSFVMKTGPQLTDYFRDKFGHSPPLDQALIEQGIQSIRAVEPLCITDAQRSIYATMERCTNLIKEDVWAAVGGMTSLLINYSNISTPAFLSFIDASNIPSQLLMAHKSALWLFFLHATNGEWKPDRPKLPALPALTNAIKHIRDKLEPDMVHHIAWPDEIRQRALMAPEKWPY